MKIALKVLITLLGIVSLGVGFLVFVKNSNVAEEIGKLGDMAGALGGLLPSTGSLKTGGIVAILGSLVTLALIVVSFMKNNKNIMIVALATIVVLLIAYFIQPDYEKGLTGGATSREIAMVQLIPGVVAAGLAILLSRQKA